MMTSSETSESHSADDPRRWVLLCECWDQAEMQVLRASLEASGLPVQIQGVMTHGVLGALQGASVRPRVLVPHSGLLRAREIAEEIIGPFDDDLPEDGEQEASPYRQPAEVEPQPRTPTVPRRKSKAVLALIAVMTSFNPIKGLAHVYMGQGTRGGVLFVVNVFAFAASLRGALWAFGVQALVWVVDVVGAIDIFRAHQRHVDALEAEIDDEEEADAVLAVDDEA